MWCHCSNFQYVDDEKFVAHDDNLRRGLQGKNYWGKMATTDLRQKSAFYGHCHTPATPSPLAVYAVSGRNHNDKHVGDTLEVRDFYLNAERHRRLLKRIDEFPWCFS